MHQLDEKLNLPMVPLRGLTVFPHMVLHFDAGRDKSIAALEEAMLGDKLCVLVTQKDARVSDVGPDDMHAVGTIAKVKQTLKLPGDSLRVLVEGVCRARVEEYTRQAPFFEAVVTPDKETYTLDDTMSLALSRKLADAFEKYNALAGKKSAEIAVALLGENDLSKLTDIIAATVINSGEDKQDILEQFDIVERTQLMLKLLQRETEIKKLEARIQNKVKKSIDKNQREYYLREQMKAIRSELGEDDSPEGESEELREKLEALDMPEDAKKKIAKEIRRYSSLSPTSQEAPMLRQWIDTLLELPWGRYTTDHVDLEKARQTLDGDHYGLEKVKERIIEHLAVCKIRNDPRGSILCLVGPPGVGKTSIASSIAKTVGREFVRMSLGGMRDEAEIRGHRRTYIGAMPGRIVSAIKQAGSMNPLVLLDEIDKLGSDHRGDPASAMLEVLDPAQNHAFRDHYLEIPFDLSKVMFITTANTTDTIPKPLLDRMEVVELSSYTENEKVEIASRHLVPKQLKEHALPSRSLVVPGATLREIVLSYTREAGVRGLERRIADICRKAAAQIVGEGRKRITITPKLLPKYLGPVRYKRDSIRKEELAGVATGLAWTAVGGETLTIEVTTLKGTGKLELTGQLGDVMKESAHAAYTFTRKNGSKWGIDPLFFEHTDIHIHIPQGAIPKDGPSAGITLATAMISALSDIAVRTDVAMTGEISLRGRVLPIGGLKEKSIAAFREGVKLIILPEDNRGDLEDIPEEVRAELDFLFVSELEQVLNAALVPSIQQHMLPSEHVGPGIHA